jgi:hypothetical protein
MTDFSNRRREDWVRPGRPVNLDVSDSDDFPFMVRGFSFATAGTISLVDEEGFDVAVESGSLAAGIVHPIACRRINNTGTTATGFLFFY